MGRANPLVDPVAAVGWLILATAVLAPVWLFRRARRRNRPTACALAGAVDLSLGIFSGALGLGHLIGVLGLAIERALGHRATAFTYDFRFSALLIVGVAVAGSGLLCLRWAGRLTTGALEAWRGAMTGTVLLLIVDLLLIPVQGFAVALSIFAAVNLAALLLTRRLFLEPTT